MTQLYRIKPLEWRQEGNVHICLTDGRYRVWKHDGQCFVVTAHGEDRRPIESIEEGKRLCQRHFDRDAASYLEPAYQTTTELPTEPGLYWWRNRKHGPWSVIKVFRVSGDLMTIGLNAPRLSIDNFVEWMGGDLQWIRIPEPEVQP